MLDIEEMRRGSRQQLTLTQLDRRIRLLKRHSLELQVKLADSEALLESLLDEKEIRDGKRKVTKNTKVVFK